MQPRANSITSPFKIILTLPHRQRGGAVVIGAALAPALAPIQRLPIPRTEAPNMVALNQALLELPLAKAVGNKASLNHPSPLALTTRPAHPHAVAELRAIALRKDGFAQVHAQSSQTNPARTILFHLAIEPQHHLAQIHPLLHPRRSSSTEIPACPANAADNRRHMESYQICATKTLPTPNPRLDRAHSTHPPQGAIVSHGQMMLAVLQATFQPAAMDVNSSIHGATTRSSLQVSRGAKRTNASVPAPTLIRHP